MFEGPTTEIVLSSLFKRPGATLFRQDAAVYRQSRATHHFEAEISNNPFLGSQTT